MITTRVATGVMATILAATTLTACTTASSPQATPSQSTPMGQTTTTAGGHHELADKRAVQRWLRHGKPVIATILTAEAKAVAAAKRNDPYAEVTICQPLQENLERAQEANGIPDRSLNRDYQRAMATLAIGTTHCLNDAHSSDTPDRLATIKYGKRGLAQFAILTRALRPYR